MSEWFKSAFGEEYLSLYAHRDSAEAEQVVDLILGNTTVPTGGVVLDVPCGAGRHLQAFQRRGFRACGFDLSLPLLAEARDEAVANGTIVRADLRAIPFKPASADLVVNLFSSIGYFEKDTENLAVLDSIVKLVRPGGWVVVDFMHSTYLQAKLRANSERQLENGITVADRRWISSDPVRVNKETRLRHPNGQEKMLNESVRLFSPAELRNALERSGVVIEQEFGSYAGEAFSEDSARIILTGRRS